MTLPHSPYAPLTGPQMSFLDDTLAALAQGSAIWCTAAGTNAIALTPATNTPAVTAYTIQGLPGLFWFQPAATSTGAVTIAVAGLAALNAYLPDGATQAGSGAFNANRFYLIGYNASLNGGVGGFIILGSSPFNALAGGSGSAASPALYFQGDTNTGIAQLTSKTWSVVINGNETIRHTASATQFSGQALTGVASITLVNGSIAGITTPISTTQGGTGVSGAGAAVSIGYAYLPGGTILQWGKTITINNGSSVSVNFAIAFSSTCFGVTATPLGAGITGGWGVLVTQSNFTLTNNIGAADNFYWQAIGL